MTDISHRPIRRTGRLPERGLLPPHERPSFADWQDRAGQLRLHIKSGRLEGPCPACGGTDRFTVSRHGVMYCRGCNPNAGNPAAFKAILEAAGFSQSETWPRRSGEMFHNTGARVATKDRRPGQPPACAVTGTASQGNPARSEAARRIWAATIPGDGTPARVYLATRCVWPPDGTGPDLPLGVRWLPRDAVPASDHASRWYGLPPAADGALVCRWRIGDSLAAVSLEGLTAGGERLPDRWRRTFGERKAALFAVRGAEAGAPVHLAEGEVSALALTWRVSGAIYATGGTSGLSGVRPPGSGPVILHADGDPQGRKAVEAARHAIAATGRACRVSWSPPGCDPADELAADVGERAAIMAECDPCGEADLVRAWQEFL